MAFVRSENTQDWLQTRLWAAFCYKRVQSSSQILWEGCELHKFEDSFVLDHGY